MSQPSRIMPVEGSLEMAAMPILGFGFPIGAKPAASSRVRKIGMAAISKDPCYFTLNTIPTT